jgi:hypothetical protein
MNAKQSSFKNKVQEMSVNVSLVLTLVVLASVLVPSIAVPFNGEEHFCSADSCNKPEFMLPVLAVQFGAVSWFPGRLSNVRPRVILGEVGLSDRDQRRVLVKRLDDALDLMERVGIANNSDYDLLWEFREELCMFMIKLEDPLFDTVKMLVYRMWLTERFVDLIPLIEQNKVLA